MMGLGGNCFRKIGQGRPLRGNGFWTKVNSEREPAIRKPKRQKKKQNHETEETASAKALRQELAYMMEEQQEGRCGWRGVREEEC